MDGERKLLTDWYARCDPGVPLGLDREEDARAYVALDAFEDPEVGLMGLRGFPAAEALLDDIEFSAALPDPRSALLFAGFRGTGKSTELSRLERLLRARGTFTVLRMRADDYHHFGDALSPEELAMVLAAGIGERAAEELGLPVLRSQGVWERMRAFFLQLPESQEWALKIGALEFKGLLRQGGDFRDRVARLLRDRPDKLREFLHTLVLELAGNLGGRQLVVLVDGFDKYHAPLDRVGDIYHRMAELFRAQAPLLHLPACHVVYTVSPYFAFLINDIAGAYGGCLHVLPSVKIHERPPRRSELYRPGLRALEAVLERRLDLDRLFGPARGPAVEALILASGGHVRDLCHLARNAVRLASRRGLPLPLDAVEEARQMLHASRGFVPRDTAEILAAVAKSGDPSALATSQLGALAVAMDNFLVLSYWNGTRWYDVHPLFRATVLGEGAPEGS
ncbi:MAG: hypothetical protein ABIO70_00750 [Pseudomonadota bacterium]